MVSQVTAPHPSEIIYPDSDGQPIADNTKQFRWIVTIKENLELLFVDQPDVFVAGDLLWYPVEGNNKTRQAPDVMVVFGRPKGDRRSYQQWLEMNLSPQVVFEILSPGHPLGEIAKKLQFYDRYGVDEYYIYDPDDLDLTGWLRVDGKLEVIDEINAWVSPRLGIRFAIKNDLDQPNMLEIFRPDGAKFLSFVELAKLRDGESQRAEQEHQRAEQESQRAEQERHRAEQERQRADEIIAQLETQQTRNEVLAAKLRELGINPDQIS